MFHAVSCLLGCLPETSNDNNQPSAITYALLGHDPLKVMSDVDLTAFIPTQRHVCV